MTVYKALCRWELEVLHITLMEINQCNIQAGAFAGGGPSLSNTSSSYWGLGGTGGLGGGGGASLGMASSSDYWNVGGQGGGGCVLIEVLEYK